MDASGLRKMVNCCNCIIPYPLVERARKLNLNISAVARKALAAEVERLEKEHDLTQK